MKTIKTTFLILISTLFAFWAKKENVNDWNEKSHGKSADPNYSVVFPDDKVNRIDIVIAKKDWLLMQTDLQTNISGSFHPEPPLPGRESKLNSTKPGNTNNIPGRKMEQRPPHGRMDGDEYEPIWVSSDVFFNKQKWSKVGIHYKGNSSLRSSFQSGVKKLSFKLDFDQFEDDYPEIKNQRFYGFKQLNLKNNYADKSFIREKVSADLFADFGIVTPKASFYKVYIDYGDGPKYFGLYTMVEEVDDTVIETGFSSEEGNLYKPEGFAATFAKGSFRTSDMNKKSTNKSKNYSDVQILYNTINNSLRNEDYELWKKQLNDVFDIDVFLKWLAANTVMQNWDSYGNTFHNYYLYGNHDTGKLQWIPWDNNEALQKGKMKGAASLSLNEIKDNWPLIRYIIDDEEWKNKYIAYVSEFSSTVFSAKKMIPIYHSYMQLLQENVIGENGEVTGYTFLENDKDFNTAIQYLKQHVQDRNFEVEDFLNTNNM